MNFPNSLRKETTQIIKKPSSKITPLSLSKKIVKELTDVHFELKKYNENSDLLSVSPEILKLQKDLNTQRDLRQKERVSSAALVSRLKRDLLQEGEKSRELERCVEELRSEVKKSSASRQSSFAELQRVERLKSRINSLAEQNRVLEQRLLESQTLSRDEDNDEHYYRAKRSTLHGENNSSSIYEDKLDTLVKSFSDLVNKTEKIEDRLNQLGCVDNKSDGNCCIESKKDLMNNFMTLKNGVLTMSNEMSDNTTYYYNTILHDNMKTCESITGLISQLTVDCGTMTEYDDVIRTMEYDFKCLQSELSAAQAKIESLKTFIATYDENKNPHHNDKIIVERLKRTEEELKRTQEEYSIDKLNYESKIQSLTSIINDDVVQIRLLQNEKLQNEIRTQEKQDNVYSTKNPHSLKQKVDQMCQIKPSDLCCTNTILTHNNSNNNTEEFGAEQEDNKCYNEENLEEENSSIFFGNYTCKIELDNFFEETIPSNPPVENKFNPLTENLDIPKVTEMIDGLLFSKDII